MNHVSFTWSVYRSVGQAQSARNASGESHPPAPGANVSFAMPTSVVGMVKAFANITLATATRGEHGGQAAKPFSRPVE